MNKKIKQTRYKQIGYIKNGVSSWQFVDLESTKENQNNTVRIGSTYKTEKELLSDAENFTTQRGFN